MLSLSQCLQATVSGRTSHSADLLHPGAGDAAMIFKIFTQQPVYFDRRQVHRVHLVSFSYKMRPVYNTLLETFFGLKVDSCYLYYLTTGHGGWGGGDEFNQKPNTLYLDGEKVISFVPWRDDCGTYRNWNPCSGNFSNGLSSSDMSRSNFSASGVTSIL